VADGFVYVNSGDAELYALNALTGAEVWSFTAAQQAPAPAVVGGVVYFGCYSCDYVYAVDAASGEELWRFSASGIILGSPAVSKGVV
jgi:outer membrane protein assembly factor BamB